MDLAKISKVVSHALRHEPHSYGLTLDGDGWVQLSSLVNALRSRDLQVTDEIIIEMINQSEKKRHQIKDGKIRAYYGHSTEQKINKISTNPPSLLYHGSVRSAVDDIIKKGLLPMSRQYVHLSADEATAVKTGMRKNGELVVIKVNSAQASEDGISFYKEENGIWLSDYVPSKYLIF
jgi:putative RNA 2'-phosphotransferase